MTLQASGVISFEDLKTEFGDSTGSISLGRYYKGTEGEVPPPQGSNNPNIPTSGSGSSISMNDFYSAQNIFATTITSTGFVDDKFGDAYGYNVGFPARGQMGQYGDNLYNFDNRLTLLQTSDFPSPRLFIYVSGIEGTPESVQAPTSVTTVFPWTTVTFTTPTSIYRYSRSSFTSTRNVIGLATQWIVTVAADLRPLSPQGTKVTVLFENNG